MGLDIQRFEIRALHGIRDYAINIRDNKIVMVGVNGLGKTSVVHLLYLVLSRQWDRALEYTFDSLTIDIGGREYCLRQESEGKGSIATLARQLRTRIRRTVPYSIYRTIPRDAFLRLADTAHVDGRHALAFELDQLLPIPSSDCRRIAQEVRWNAKQFNKPLLDELDTFLETAAGSMQVLYLPTYRRIEKELSLIFPDLEHSIHSFQRRKGVLSIDGARNYIELVEFGMEDVDATFHLARQELVETTRSELKSLASGYLRDVIRGEGEQYDLLLFHQLDEATIDRILNRAEEHTLSEADKSRLRTVITKLKTPDGVDLQPVDRYIAHFFAKLVNIDRALAEREQQIIRFADVCNKYLTAKKLVYNDKDSSISVTLTPSDTPLPLKVLSSGEKQIISLFSHLYLRGNRSIMVIIDEPELSLSVTWQQQLLPDILGTAKCHFLAAVTHSPFIFDNELDCYAVDLKECISEASQ